MEVSDELIRECTRRLMLSRMRLLCNNGFYGILLMHAKMGISDVYETAWASDGDKITFNPGFMKSLSDTELDYVMMHEILHIVLDHLSRMRIDGKDARAFNVAADIVVNSNILRSCGGNLQSISLAEYDGPQMHTAPDGSEGWTHTVEEVYEMLSISFKEQDKAKKSRSNIGSQSKADAQEVDESDEEGNKQGEQSDGEQSEGGQSKEKNGGSLNGNKQEGQFDEEQSKNNNGGTGEGWDFHVFEEDGGLENGDTNDTADQQERDSQRKAKREFWKACVLEAMEALSSQRIARDSKDCGDIPVLAERFLEELRKPQTDWRTILDEFIQEDIVDYSFTPPDRRFGDGPFFLPDFNEKDDRVEKVLFMIDTSGSMSDKSVTTVYSEVKGAIDQFGGKLEGWLGFFDAEVVKPKAFSNEEEFMIIRPKGGGGTNFQVIFQYVNEHMSNENIMSIVILTDGYGPYPDEGETHGVPVLWIINNEDVTPPWGKVARVKP